MQKISDKLLKKESKNVERKAIKVVQKRLHAKEREKKI